MSKSLIIPLVIPVNLGDCQVLSSLLTLVRLFFRCAGGKVPWRCNPPEGIISERRASRATRRIVVCPFQPG